MRRRQKSRGGDDTATGVAEERADAPAGLTALLRASSGPQRRQHGTYFFLTLWKGEAPSLRGRPLGLLSVVAAAAVGEAPGSRSGGVGGGCSVDILVSRTGEKHGGRRAGTRVREDEGDPDAPPAPTATAAAAAAVPLLLRVLGHHDRLLLRLLYLRLALLASAAADQRAGSRMGRRRRARLSRTQLDPRRGWTEGGRGGPRRP